MAAFERIACMLAQPGERSFVGQTARSSPKQQGLMNAASPRDVRIGPISTVIAPSVGTIRLRAIESLS
ncbi:MAG TPA: hypothetical protein VLX85_09035 [Stellaceae bacterium]|nr:hypothetical protein [Stellaceae bacterium]